VYTNIQPVVKPVVQPVHRFDNRLYRVNGVLDCCDMDCVVAVLVVRESNISTASSGIDVQVSHTDIYGRPME